MKEQPYSIFRFADVEVREREFRIYKQGQAQDVEPRAFQVLLFLLRHPNQLIRKDELLEAVWSDCSVSENSLTRCVTLLRRVLGDDTREPRYIATVVKVGYRFVCEVEVVEESAGLAAAAPATRERAGSEHGQTAEPEDKGQTRGRQGLTWLRGAGVAVTVLLLCLAGVGVLGWGPGASRRSDRE